MKIAKFMTLFLVMSLLLSGCSLFREMTEEEKLAYAEWRASQPVYTSSTSSAIITDIDSRHWFAVTHHYQCAISVYCEEYDLEYSSCYTGSGMYGKPSYFDKRIGDTVNVEICTTTVKGEVTNVRIVKVKD